jgi:hypothetical protein
MSGYPWNGPRRARELRGAKERKCSEEEYEMRRDGDTYTVFRLLHKSFFMLLS